MRASFDQVVKIKDAIALGDRSVQDLMREQLRGACEAATDVLKETESQPVREGPLLDGTPGVPWPLTHVQWSRNRLRCHQASHQQ